MDKYKQFSFITKYLVRIITMAILSNETLGLPSNNNGHSMIAFHEGKAMKDGPARGT